MDFRFAPEEEDFRREVGACLKQELPPQYEGDLSDEIQRNVIAIRGLGLPWG